MDAECSESIASDLHGCVIKLHLVVDHYVVQFILCICISFDSESHHVPVFYNYIDSLLSLFFFVVV